MASIFAILIKPVDSLAAFWPANAILLGMMVRFNRSATVYGWVAAFLGFSAAEFMTGHPVNVSLWFTTANMTGAITGWLLFTLLNSNDRRIKRPLSFLYVVLICLASAFVSACTGGGVLDIFLGFGIPASLNRWFVAEFANKIAIVPVFLSYPGFKAVRTCWRQSRTQEGFSSEKIAPILSLLGLLILGHLVDGPGIIGFLVPALLWCAMTYSVFTTAVITMVSCCCLLLSVEGFGLLYPELAEIHAFQPSIRFGIALMSVGPLLVAAKTASRSRTIHELIRIAYYDQLTGLLSRSTFKERGEKLLRESIRKQEPLTVVMLDIDHFKRINDQNGHAAGDMVLKHFALTVRSGLRDADVLGRLGGEEFAMVLPQTSARDAEVIAARIRSAVQEGEFYASDGRRINVTVSIGIAERTNFRLQTLDELLAHADECLYAAKAAGRNTVVLSPSSRTRSEWD
ncbi:sensor domain-containing diguanylate cyclase [Agrobacterium tumefaciens]|uniref:sensor domain-containing diguanylate cyclase n=1 Tax=Agrobacterium tumefaciens TaxID=358 RepID=UPI001178449D|nr:GGDEF domain-containing protein [Agrobacterium tumefaciens]